MLDPVDPAFPEGSNADEGVVGYPLECRDAMENTEGVPFGTPIHPSCR